ncbi:MAG TPA: beta-ketoacyl-[acyl-carrier-protein] synthase family protein [Thermoanaerobaculia bacterium]|nr:beta-ketoacyl-[acyl-carrier-protein] synthase family protein [Thermoanaerobaculia bacterium]
MTPRRVVVTGLGSISAAGATQPELWEAVVAGRSAIRQIQRTFGTLTMSCPGAAADCYQPRAHFDARQLLFNDRFAQFAVVAAREAVRDASLSTPDDGRTAVILGNGNAGDESREEAVLRATEGKRRCSPTLVPRISPQSAVGFVSIDLALRGPAFNVSTGCAAATHAIGLAFDMVRRGAVERALTGGSEAALTFSTLTAFDAMHIVAADTCRPFSGARSGMVLGEGAGVVVLETLDAARGRGARIYAEVAGFGMTADAGDPVHPSIDGPAAAMAAALADAGLDAESIDYVTAHGTGTLINDRVETLAIRRVFGEHAARLMVSSTKAVHGHALGATGALELCATAMALFTGIVPPTANFTERDAECDLDYVPNTARRAPLRAAISSSFAFGGLNAVVALRRFDEAEERVA